jgi:membrane peptidoglycan carboxypeptidase
MGDIPLAANTMEDPGFYHHRGFILQAFSNSFLDNVKQGKFVRGGSTITMQLAKNLWLTREKTIGRKAQEFFLAQALESCYTKDEIMELYLNVVEFGPNRYGVSSGSQHWFKKHPGDLTPTEAFWLASILPRPSKVPPPNEQSLSRIDALMKRLASDGKIPDFALFEFDDESIDDAIEAAEPQEEKEN